MLEGIQGLLGALSILMINGYYISTLINFVFKDEPITILYAGLEE